MDIGQGINIYTLACHIPCLYISLPYTTCVCTLACNNTCIYVLWKLIDLRDLGMTLTLTFKIKGSRPCRDLSNKKKIIDLSHTVTEIHALIVYRPHVKGLRNFEGS